MEQPEALPQDEVEEEMTRIVTTGIKIFLISLEARLADQQHDDPNESLGKIQIIVDEDGDISALLAKQKQDPKTGTFVVRVPSREAAYGMDLFFTQWACSPHAVASIIASLDQRYTNPSWIEDLEIATEEVVAVLGSAVVIEQRFPMHAFLRKAAKAPRAPKKSTTWIIDKNPRQGARG